MPLSEYQNYLVSEYFSRGSCYVSPQPVGLPRDRIVVPNSKESIIVIFLHGSAGEDQKDICRPKPGQWSTTPPVVTSLAVKNVLGREIFVLAACTCVEPLEAKLAPADQTKIYRRMLEVGTIADLFDSAGFSRSRMFFIGHSAGAWCSLSYLAQNMGAFAGAIGFAPAFAGKKVDRLSSWALFRSLSFNDLTVADKFPALVYGFENDEFENADDLSFFGKSPTEKS